MDSYEGYPDPALQTFLMGRYILIPWEVRCFVPYLPLFFISLAIHYTWISLFRFIC